MRFNLRKRVEYGLKLKSMRGDVHVKKSIQTS